MRKVIAAMNMTLDGFCDHTAMIANDEIHQHYNDLLSNAGILVYGRKTYQLMESYWPAVVKDPTGNKPTDDFAVLIDNISKVVFSHTLENVEWNNSQIAKRSLEEEISALRQEPGKDIFIGSPGLIAAATNLGLIDEYQISVHPTVAGKGLILFKDIREKVDLKLFNTKIFGCGAVTLYYESAKNPTDL